MQAIILYSVGSPEALNNHCIKQYLNNFLSDKCVVRINSFLWQPILHTFILTSRPERLKQRYAKVFQNGQNPYLAYMDNLTHKLETALNQGLALTNQSFIDSTIDESYELSHSASKRASKYIVRYAYAYCAPSLALAVKNCINAGANKITTIPLFPQYSDTTSKRPVVELKRYQQQYPDCKFEIVRSFSAHTQYIKALSELAKPYLDKATATHKQEPHVMITYHSLPKSYIQLGDPYLKECQATTLGLINALGLDPDQYTVAFQSKMGPMSWLQPYIEDACTSIIEAGHHNLVVIAPGFSVDCLETLYDLGHNLKTQFLTQGGENFMLVPSLNDCDIQVELMQSLVSTAQEV